MIHAVRSLFSIRSRTENPRVGGSIPSLAIPTEVKAEKRVSRKSRNGASKAGLVANGVTLSRFSPSIDVRPAYERINLRGFVAAWRLLV